MWPVLSSLNRKTITENQLFFSKIKLGEQIDELNDFSKIQIKATTPAKKWAISLLKVIQSIRKADKMLSEYGDSGIDLMIDWMFQITLAMILSRTDFNKLKFTEEIATGCLSLKSFINEPSRINTWWKVAQQILMLNTNGHPESIDELYQIGCYNKKHISSLKKVELIHWDNVDDLNNERSANANVRAAIFKRLKKEFGSIVRSFQTKTIRDEPVSKP